MFGFVVIEVMTLSGHPLIINEKIKAKKTLKKIGKYCTVVDRVYKKKVS